VTCSAAFTGVKILANDIINLYHAVAFFAATKDVYIEGKEDRTLAGGLVWFS